MMMIIIIIRLRSDDDQRICTERKKKKGSEVPSFYGLRHWRSLILLLKIYDDGG